MSEKYYHELEEKNNLRENLSLLRSAVKDPQEKEKILALAGGRRGADRTARGRGAESEKKRGASAGRSGACAGERGSFRGI